MSLAIKQKWDAIYRNSPDKNCAAPVLTDHVYLLPKRGVALDLACGLGANALFLAEAGLEVHAWDISSVALDLLQRNAAGNGLDVTVRQLEIDAFSMPENMFDVIVINRFLDRALCNAIMAALKRNGLLFYQTFTVDKLSTEGPKNPGFLLKRNELISLFEPLTLVYYKENACIGDLKRGERNEALFIGQKI